MISYSDRALLKSEFGLTDEKINKLTKTKIDELIKKAKRLKNEAHINSIVDSLFDEQQEHEEDDEDEDDKYMSEW